MLRANGEKDLLRTARQCRGPLVDWRTIARLHGAINVPEELMGDLLLDRQHNQLWKVQPVAKAGHIEKAR
jgi:hypothetical protein